MANYNKSIIYKLVDRDSGDTYFGATREPINRRISKHKCRQTCRCRDIIRNNNYQIIILEEYDSHEISKTFLLTRERHYICSYDCVNKVVPTNETRIL